MAERINKSFPKKTRADHHEFVSGGAHQEKNDTSKKNNIKNATNSGMPILLDGLWYLAHPYTVYNDNGTNNLKLEKCNYINACKLSAKALRAGIKIYSPISHTHPIHVYGGFVGTNLDFWLQLDKEFMMACVGMILCDGWEESEGCRFEVDYFKTMNKPILLLEEALKVLGKQ